ncbi:hypothetical protein ACQEVB_23045 [Pseudonocardia sp. CA-107938]|uniref:hypothetical protein n=1 Tax=Pseudonocardia sp. CA-107938 TaxID=3240021 RepID=UPI003D93CEEC
MIRAAELFVQAEDMLVEVLGRIRGDDWRIMLPPMVAVVGHPAARRRTVRQAVVDHLREQAVVPDLLAGATLAEPPANPLGSDPQETVVRLSAAACAAVAEVVDGTAVVHLPGGDRTAEAYLWQLDVSRCWLAHDVAMHLGSRACPFPESLARAMWEHTAPDAERWRAEGWFAPDPLPMPDDVSWRDRFLRTAGRDPHPAVH